MMALTICQPYADLILLPDDHDDAKRVENRTWLTEYRGPLLIHSGKSLEWLGLTKNEVKEIYPDMVFGAILGVVDLRACYSVTDIHAGLAKLRYPWLSIHKHVSGPYCWVFAECQRFQEPVPYRGERGLFQVPKSVVQVQLDLLNVR